MARKYPRKKIDLLATKIMGWHHPYAGSNTPNSEWAVSGKGVVANYWRWNPFMNIADAWMVVERMCHIARTWLHRGYAASKNITRHLTQTSSVSKTARRHVKPSAKLCS